MPWKFPDAKAAVDKEWKKLETISAWQLDNKVKSKKEVILEAQRDRRKVHFAALMDIGNLKNAGFGNHNFRSTKAESCSEVTLQRTTREHVQSSLNRVSCASQMNYCWKVMDLTARQPDCDGQAADAVSAYTPVQMEDAPRLLRKP